MKTEHTTTGLPLPKWCFVLLGIPTFYMPLAYLALGVWVVAGTLAGGIGDRPEWMMRAAYPTLYVIFGMLPIYVAWVVLSTRLSRREKVLWLFIVLFLNMAGMPMFYVFMIRRYLGLEGRMGKRDEAAMNKFLSRHAVSRDGLSSDQLAVLQSYCRTYRLTKLSFVLSVAPMIAVAAFTMYMAVVTIPRGVTQRFPDSMPTRLVVVDRVNDTRKESVPDSEAKKSYVQIVMMLGAMAGGAAMFGVMSVFVLVASASQLWGNWHRKALIEFLKATDRANSNGQGGGASADSNWK